ncbi:MAG: hypothetical protein ACXU82_18120 [Caulobacteraceae bacterium]
MAHEASLDEFIRDANLKLVRSRLSDTFDPSHRQTLLDLIEALESGEAIPAKALEAGLRPG